LDVYHGGSKLKTSFSGFEYQREHCGFQHLVIQSKKNKVTQTNDALVRIILPEGASNIEIETPYAVTRLQDTLHFTYLDVKGRSVVENAAKNLVENHIQPFKVS